MVPLRPARLLLLLARIHLVAIPVVSASAIFGHTETVIWEASLGIAAYFGLGAVLSFSKKDGLIRPMLWFLFRVGVWPSCSPPSPGRPTFHTPHSR